MEKINILSRYRECFLTNFSCYKDEIIHLGWKLARVTNSSLSNESPAGSRSRCICMEIKILKFQATSQLVSVRGSKTIPHSL